MTAEPRTKLVAAVPANGTAVVVTIHDRVDLTFETYCSGCELRFFTIGYTPGATVTDIKNARRGATRAGFQHAVRCDVGLPSTDPDALDRS